MTLRLVGGASRPRVRGMLGMAVLGGLLLTEMPGASISNADRVRFHWDWATQPMQSGAGANSSAKHQRVPLVRDFSHRQVIFQENVPARVMDRVRNDSRFWLQYLERHARRTVPFPWNHVPDPNQPQAVVRDWSYSLNNGSGGTVAMPAKYS